MLSESEKHFLLRAARESIESAVRETPLPEISTNDKALLAPSGAFVTLRIAGELRGCIGYVDAIKPLVHTVQEVAAKAALEDTRFPAVEEVELTEISIEISVISPMKRLYDLSELMIGTHGILLEYAERRGLLLPQVAMEYGWEPETFVLQTARKAGVVLTDWKHANVFTFTAEVFHE
jgi:AmmeMemoRadiSam system protein A